MTTLPSSSASPPAPTSSGGSPLLDMQGIQKSFAGVAALAQASLTVGAGEVHALIGQNGAGKSTMIKVLTGAYQRDGGSITFAGGPAAFSSPLAAQLGGIATIYQEVNLIALRTVAENIFLGREPKKWGLIQWPVMNAEASRLLKELGISLDVTQPLGTFSTAIQQMVALARAVSINARLVIMDEPTSSLNEREVETLFGVIRGLKDRGVSVIFVSHRLDELYAVCDRITVMRDGRTVYAGNMADISRLQLVEQMLGREIKNEGAQTGFVKSGAGKSGEPLLKAEGIRLGQRLSGASVAVRQGEVVGLAGLLGSGRSELARVIFGADTPDAGTVTLDGQPAHFRTPAEAIRAGLGFCSEDRKAEGIIPELSVRENLTLAILPRLARAGVVDTARQSEIVDRFVAQLGIKTSNPDQPIRELSGGNQQKVLLARWLATDPRLLILDEPTRGIDVGAKAEIQRLIGELAQDGLGVLMISSELEELIEGCHEVTVLHDGHSVARLSGDRITEPELLHAMAQGAGAQDIPAPQVRL
ncbi:sugar ABC transporter ATP-binding protein [Deinococcus marmoris]|uniref:Ribose ABC transport system, ATP-binding protein RbsA n=1 Tax=Deinococcus marmoris TaxID=249408 RepID=A0A1U7P1F1_9DEIO|nr:sugar ABC transporter ATP-binding protein [Deinococcus marmoris]OLV18991.1 Ribose ABC transport system, ATP-binding protein RbsA [Deinococcus marmoris]